MAIEPDKTYTLREAAELLAVHERTLERNAKAGKFPAFKVGRVWRVSGAALRDFMQPRPAEREPDSR